MGKDAQELIIKDISLRNTKDERVIREIVYSSLKFFKRRAEDIMDERPIRIRYFGVFAQKEKMNKCFKRLAAILSKDESLADTAAKLYKTKDFTALQALYDESVE